MANTNRFSFKKFNPIFSIEKKFQRAICLSLAFCLTAEVVLHPSLAIGLPSANTSGMPQPTRLEQIQVRRELAERFAGELKTGFGGINPAVKELFSLDIREVRKLIPNFTGTPVDQDPFFLRSQRWEAGSRASKFETVTNGQTTTISVAGSDRKLKVNLGLQALIQTDEYLFFSIDSKSDVLKKAARVNDFEGSGLFIVEVSRLQQQAQNGKPVAFHFLPLPGTGWNTKLLALQITEGDFIALSSDTDVMPLAMSDIRKLVQMSKINLDMSMMVTLSNPKRLQDFNKDEAIYPAAGSTALFGLLPTGLDLSRPGFNFYRDVRSFLPTSTTSSLLNQVMEKHALLNEFLGIKTAQADGPDILAESLQKSALFLGIIATTLVTSWVLTFGKNKLSRAVNTRLDEIRAYRRSLNPEAVDAEKMIGFRNFMRVWGSTVSSVAQFPLISPGLSVQYYIDRTVPALGAGDHTLMRKVLNQTVYPNVRHFGNISISEKPTILGAGYAATVGVGVTIAHYGLALPLFVEMIAPSLPEGLGYAMNENFSGGNAATRDALITNGLVGISIGVLRGPADLTMDLKSQVVDLIHAEVDEQLRKEGKNPDDPKIKSDRERRINDRMDLTLVQKSLPSSQEKLFDTMSFYTSVVAARGFATPNGQMLQANLNPAVAATVERDEQNQIKENDFILASRRGMYNTILERSLALARQWHELNPSEETRAAVLLGEKIIAESNRIRQSIPKIAAALLEAIQKGEPGYTAEKGWTDWWAQKAIFEKMNREVSEISQRALAHRQLVVLANYEGSVEAASRYVPVTWKNEFGASATNMWVRYMRQSTASLLDGSKTDNMVARPEDILKYRDSAIGKAIAEMKAQDPRLAGRTIESIADDPSLQAEINQRANIIIKNSGDKARARAAARDFTVEHGWVEQWRHKSALTRAEIRLGQYIESNRENILTFTPEAQAAMLRKFYIYESARQIGLHIQGLTPDKADARPEQGAPWQASQEKYDQLMAELQDKTEAVFKRQSSTLNMKTYLRGLSEEDRAEQQLRMRAAIFTSLYRDAISLGERLPLVDTSQPGFTQRARLAVADQTVADLNRLRELEEQATSKASESLYRFRYNVVSIAGSVTNRGLRFVDGFFGDQNVDQGFLGVLHRRVPFLEDVVSANMRNLRFWPVAFSVSWAWSHFALGTGIGYSFWVTSILFQGFFIMAPAQWLWRNIRLQGFKPYETTKPGWSGVMQLARKYSLVELMGYSVGFLAVFPGVLFESQLGRVLMDSIGTPVANGLKTFSPLEIAAVVTATALAAAAGGKWIEYAHKKLVNLRLAALAKPTEAQAKAASSKVAAKAEDEHGAVMMCTALFN